MFRLAHELTQGHTDSINTLAFSPCGVYLASGGDDRQLIIWRVSDGTLLFQLVLESAVTAVIWHPTAKGVIFCACENGAFCRLKDLQKVCTLRQQSAQANGLQIRDMDLRQHFPRSTYTLAWQVKYTALTMTVAVAASPLVLLTWFRLQQRLQKVHFHPLYYRTENQALNIRQTDR